MEALTVSVRVVDGHGARVGELSAVARPSNWQALGPGEQRTWELVAGLDPATATLELGHVQLVPADARFCDGAIWRADGTSVPPNPMLQACPSEVDLGLAPALEVRDGRLHGRGYSFAIPDGYEVDDRWRGWALRRHGVDEWIGILPAKTGWRDLDPAAFDLAQCRDLLSYNMSLGNQRFDVQHVGRDITTCARYIDSRSEEIIQEIIVATPGEDVRIGCAYPATSRGCLDLAASAQFAAP